MYMLMGALLAGGSLALVFAQPDSADTNVNLRVSSPVPAMSVNRLTESSLIVLWNWDYVSPGYVPPSVARMDVEISSDGVNYGVLQQELPNEFESVYTGLSLGSYTARVTLIDGQNESYIIGPVVLNVPGGRRERDSFSDSTSDPAAESTQVEISGLSLPGPSSVVIFTVDGSFLTSISPASNGSFSYSTVDLPAGVGTFSFSAQDPVGELSAPLVFDLDVLAGSSTIVEDLYLAPTVSVPVDVATVGESFTVSGYAYKDAQVLITLDGLSSTASLVRANEQGAWNFILNTSALLPGTYSLKVLATSADGTVISPESRTETLEIVTGVLAAPVCGNSVIEAPPEECDDGNAVDGDGCSSSCLLEGVGECGDGVLNIGEDCDDGNVLDGDGCGSLCISEGLPQSQLNQPSQDTFEVNFVNLSYSKLAEPNGPIVMVKVYYSRDGAGFVPFSGTFVNETVSLTGLRDGVYELYSIATDVSGATEKPPKSPDVVFTIDVIPDFQVQAWPEKRIPSVGNWSLPVRLSLHKPLSTQLSYSFDFTTDDMGMTRIDSNIDSGQYSVLLKGLSHLSKRLDSVDFSGAEDFLLDFTLGGVFYLLAGDVHGSKDDTVNGLDVSAAIARLYTSSPDADLNSDGYVNALDMSVMLTNLYKEGDGEGPRN